MSFSLVTGTMGGGKSLYVVRKCMKAFKEGALVHSNIDWRPGALQERGWEPQHITLGDDPTKWVSMLKAGQEGKENVVAIDESAMIFHVWDQRGNQDRDRSIFDLLVMSRKLGLEVYFITQHEENVAVAIRRMANDVRRCIAVKNVPIIGPLVARLKGDFLIRFIQPLSGLTLASEYCRYDPEAGKLYATDATKGVAATVDKLVTRTSETRPRVGWQVWAFVAFLLFSIGVFIWGRMRTPEPIIPRRKPATEEPTKELSIKDGIRSFASQTLGDKDTSVPPARWPYNDETPPDTAYGFPVEPALVRVITAVVHRFDSITIYTDGGDTWNVGKRTAAGTVQIIYDVGSEFILELDTGKAIYLRQRTFTERRAWSEWVISQQSKRQASQATKSTAAMTDPIVMTPEL